MPNIDFDIISEVILPKLLFMTLTSFVAASMVGAVVGGIATRIWKPSPGNTQQQPRNTQQDELPERPAIPVSTLISVGIFSAFLFAILLLKLTLMSLLESFVVASIVMLVVGGIATQIWKRSRGKQPERSVRSAGSLIPVAIFSAFIGTLLGLLIWEANPESLISSSYGALGALVFYVMILPIGSLIGSIGGSIIGALLPAHLKQRKLAGLLAALTYSICGIILYMGLASPPLVLTTAPANTNAPFPVVAEIKGYDSSVKNGYNDAPRDIALSADGTMLAVRTNQRNADKIDIWNLTEQKLAYTFKENSQPRTLKTMLSSVAFSQEGKQLITAASQEVQLRDLNGEVRQRFAGGEFGLPMQGNRLVTLSVVDPWKNPPDIEGTLKVWDIATGKLLQTIPADISKGFYESLPIAASLDQRLIAFPPKPGSNLMEVWDITTGKQVGQFAGNRGVMVREVAFAPDGQQIATIMDQDLQIWNWQENKLVRSIASKSAGQTLAWTEAGIFAIRTGMVNGDQTTTLWNPQTGEPFKAVALNLGQSRIAMSQDGKTLAVYQYKAPQSVSVWRLAKG